MVGTPVSLKCFFGLEPSCSTNKSIPSGPVRWYVNDRLSGINELVWRSSTMLRKIRRPMFIPGFNLIQVIKSFKKVKNQIYTFSIRILVTFLVIAVSSSYPGHTSALFSCNKVKFVDLISLGQQLLFWL